MSGRRGFERDALQYRNHLYAGALRLTCSRPDAEDLVQDTYVRALQFWDKFEPGTNMKAWLFRIMINAFNNQYRQLVRERETLRDPGCKDALEHGFTSAEGVRLLHDPEDAFFDSMLSAGVVAALAAVPSKFLRVVLLADLYEFSYKEIMNTIGCPIGTVMSRLHRGRRRLQPALRGYAVERGIVRHLPPIPAEVPDEA